MEALDRVIEELNKQGKKNYNTNHDLQVNNERQLSRMAAQLTHDERAEFVNQELLITQISSVIDVYLPNWSVYVYQKLMRKPYEDRLRIAAALLIKELERIIQEPKTV